MTSSSLAGRDGLLKGIGILVGPFFFTILKKKVRCVKTLNLLVPL
jgi:hypothetical protein